MPSQCNMKFKVNFQLNCLQGFHGKNKNWNELPTGIADRSKLICKVRHNENCSCILSFALILKMMVQIALIFSVENFCCWIIHCEKQFLIIVQKRPKKQKDPVSGKRETLSIHVLLIQSNPCFIILHIQILCTGNAGIEIKNFWLTNRSG